MSTGAEETVPNVPVTKGGFSNDGSEIISRTVSQPTSFISSAGVSESHTLHSSGSTIEEYYEIAEIVQFVMQNGYKNVALQFPDDLIIDATNIVTVLQHYFAEKEYVVSLHVLGDTSYAPCCVDEVAAQHVDSDALIHFGPSCLAPSKRLPVFYSFGRLPRSHAQSIIGHIVSTVMDESSPLYEKLHEQLLDEEELEEPSYYDEEDYGWDSEKLRIFHTKFQEARSYVSSASSPGYSRYLLVLYDRQYNWLIEYVRSELLEKGIRVIMTNALGEEIASPSDIKYVTHVTVVLAYTDVPVSQALQATTQPKTLQFSGFQWPVPFSTFPGGAQGDIASDIRAMWDDIPAKYHWRYGFTADLWSGLFICSPSLSSSSENDSTAAISALPSSQALAENFSLNFPSLILSMCVASSDSSLPGAISVVSGSREQSRLLARRYYLVEKAKNSEVFGIVVCTLTANYYASSILRMKQLIRAAGRRVYLISVGKVNEPKLLNFPEVECFVMVSCPLSVILQRQGVIATSDVITPVELEFALGEGREWTGEYSTDFTSVFNGSGRLGVGPKEELESVKPVVSSKPTSDEQDNEPRFSLIDGKYHQKSSQNTATDATPATTNYELVENVSSRQLTEGSQKLSATYTRTYFGLEGNAEPSELAMTIQPGLYGTAKGYTSVEMDNAAQTQDDKQPLSTCTTSTTI